VDVIEDVGDGVIDSEGVIEGVGDGVIDSEGVIDAVSVIVEE
jgi:hypothetical protein